LLAAGGTSADGVALRAAPRHAGEAASTRHFPHLPSHCRSLADFQLTKQLYKGKASTLYQATDKQSGAVVALKSYSKRRLSPLNWYQVEREVRLHAQLRHPNIIALHAAFEDDNYVFLVTEFADGGWVLTRCAERGCWPKWRRGKRGRARWRLAERQAGPGACSGLEL